MGFWGRIKAFFNKAIQVFNDFIKQVFTDGLKEFIGLYISDAIEAAGEVEGMNLESTKAKQDKWLELFKKKSKGNPEEMGDWAINLLRELAVVKYNVKF